ncbi:MAG TPA: hypothetical protein VFS71_09395 [Flavobacterium sp.]|uniref:hypothetical protein n=1 Tax=Flavobacterium sp. TaxID=239 RepID=UPI002DB5DD78|nr:hypothetical protein [Flavobacterium sp.]HEU4789888.1 hypothetical protein [Flavobacterium sp.]
MKKFKNLIGALLLVFISCSDNGTQESIQENKKLLLKSIQEISPSSGLSTIFTYDGFKIKEVSTTGINIGPKKITYAYTGDLITQENGYVGDILYFSNEYTYENNKLKTAISKITNGGTIFPPINETKLIYNYLPENIVEINSYTYSFISDWEQSQFLPKVKVYFNEDNIIKRETMDSDGQIISRIDYEYDNNPNIYKNVIGFNKLFSTNDYTNNFNRHFNIKDINNANNVIKFKETINGFITESEHYNYTVNLDGYPDEKRSYWSSNQYLIEKKYTYY